MAKPEPPKVERTLPYGWILLHDYESKSHKDIPVQVSNISLLRPYNDRTIVGTGGAFVHAVEDINTIMDMIRKNGSGRA